MRGRKSRSPHNFSRETRKGLPGFGLRAADRGPQDSPTLSRQRERLPPALGKTNRFGYLENKSKNTAWNRLSLKQIKKYRFFGYLIETHDVPLIPLKKKRIPFFRERYGPFIKSLLFLDGLSASFQQFDVFFQQIIVFFTQGVILFTPVNILFCRLFSAPRFLQW